MRIKPIKFDKRFRKSFRERIRNQYLKAITREAIRLFQENPNNIILNVHSLKGSMKGKQSFLVDSDIRIIFIETETQYIFLDIGSHSDVYTS